MQLMEHSMDSLSVSMIIFPTRTILDGEIIPTYGMGTSLNKVIKAGNSIPMDFSPNRIISKTTPSIHKLQCLAGLLPQPVFY
jgi:hypothetical protein